MYDPTIHAQTISRHFKASDFVADKSLLDAANSKIVVEQAVALGCAGFASISLKANKLRGKDVYQVTDLAENLVLRHVASNIRRVTGVKQDDRQFIVTCIKEMLSEGTTFRVYKFDIASFYESVRVEGILHNLGNDIAFSGQSVRALRSLFTELEKAGICGLPRGLSISATLAEYLLRTFDGRMSDTGGIWFYARFVDDILIVTDGKEDREKFTASASRFLPTGLFFNSKSASFDFKPFAKPGSKGQEACFDFLGYRFSVSHVHRSKDDKLSRAVWLDIAPNKVSKLKTRIAKSLLTYSKENDFENLLARIRLLTSNFNFVDRKSGVRRTSGIYFNYPLVSSEASLAIPALDKYLRSAITSPHPKNKLRPSVSPADRQKLVNLTFSDGFKNKRFFSFGSSRLAELTSCWSYA
jgi:Reverse transcriptase (RNA-dependent DNA polymerase)